jgi:HK97 family phage prohead protease
MTPETRLTNSARLSPAFEVRFKADDDAGAITGLAAGFGDRLVDAYGDVIAAGAFRKSIEAHEAAGTMPAMLWQHDPSEPIGVWTEISETDKGLTVAGKLNLDTQRGREALSLLRQGALSGLSIGFVAKAAEPTKGGRRLTEVDLWEVSLVTFPARQEGRVTEIRSARDLEKLLRDAGLPRAAATKAASGGWPALSGEPNRNLAELARMMKRTAERLKG